MEYGDFIKAIEYYGSTKEDICRILFGLNIGQINDDVIIAPWWEPALFNNPEMKIELLGKSASIYIWNITLMDHPAACHPVTYIKTGIGAPILTDVVLALGLTRCKKLLFIGSAGSLDVHISIGDIVIPEFSVSGNGVSRYLAGGRLADHDPFGEKAFPDKALFEDLKRYTDKICTEAKVKYFIGKTFSIDTVFAQFVYIDEILNMGCNTIEMETAAAFKAAQIAHIPMAALFIVSDNTLTGKSLVSGRTREDMKYCAEVRKTVFPKIWEKVFDIKNNFERE